MEFHKHVIQINMINAGSMAGFSLAIADSVQELPGIKPGKLSCHTSILTTVPQEVEHYIIKSTST